MNDLIDVTELTENETEILELILSRGSIHQSDIWKMLDITSQSVSKNTQKLEEMGYIEREQVTYNGSNTNLITPTVRTKDDVDYSLLLANDILPPFIAEDDITIESDSFDHWVLELEQEYRNK